MFVLLLAQSDPPASDPGQVTTAWMAGVVGMMLLFGVIAAIGYVRKPKEKVPVAVTEKS